MSLSLAHSRRASPQLHEVSESRLVARIYSSCCFFDQTADTPEIPLDSGCHCGSASNRSVALYEIVVGEVKGYRCLEILTLLAECVGQASQAAHVKARCPVKAFDVTCGCQRHI